MKLKYIFFLSAALSLTGCNDGFLDRGPQDLNDKTFWNTVKDLETYANAFYGILPDGVTNLGDENSDNQIPFKPNSILFRLRMESGRRIIGETYATSIIS